MGAVYRAVQMPLGRVVAVKVIRPDQRDHDFADLRTRFLAEARVLAELSSPYIVTLHDFGEEGGLLYMVQEMAKGSTLTRLLQDHGRLPLKRAVRLAIQLLRGLSVPHARGVVHRDIKPDNLIIGLDPQGTDQVKLIDFGIAKELFRHSKEDTGSGMAIGTPRYMSPEQLGRGSIGPWTDQYAVGALLYEMLTGYTPFNGTPAEIITAHLQEPPPGVPPALGVPLAVELVLQRALSKAPASRFPDVTVMAQALAQATRTSDTASLPALNPQLDDAWRPSGTHPLVQKRRRRGRFAVYGFALLLALMEYALNGGNLPWPVDEEPPLARTASTQPPQSQASTAPYDIALAQAHHFLAKGRLELAVSAFERAHHLRPGERAPSSSLCVTLEELGRVDAALPHCRDWLEREPNDRTRAEIIQRVHRLGQAATTPRPPR